MTDKQIGSSIRRFGHLRVGRGRKSSRLRPTLYKYMKYTPETYPRQKWPNFSFNELCCSHTGELDINDEFMTKLQNLRDYLDQPLVITSAYRSPLHPVELAKSGNTIGSHVQGCAADIQCMGSKAHKILTGAAVLGFTGIGVSQSGDYDKRFLHLDTMKSESRPSIWSY